MDDYTESYRRGPEDIKDLNAYMDTYKLKKNEQKSNKEGHKSRFDDVKEERKDYEFNLVEEKKVAELAILNDTLALIYDYISEKK